MIKFIPHNHPRTLPHFVSTLLSLILLSVPLVVRERIAPSSTPHSAMDNFATTSVTRARLETISAKLPISFEADQENRGGFLARSRNLTLRLTPAEAVLQLRAADCGLRMKLIGANPQPRLSGQQPLPGKTNYLLGRDPRQWRTGVAHYRQVRYEAIYHGIDMIYHGDQQRLEYDFIVAPGANPRKIRLRFDGAERMRIDETGDLILETKAGVVRHRRPVVYQEAGGRRRTVTGRYEIVSKREVRFKIGSYDTGCPLIIDPTLDYASYFGGSGRDVAQSSAVDASGNLYLAGFAGTPDIPTPPGAIRNLDLNESAAFVAKFNPAGDTLLYLTYLGGSAGEEAIGLAVDTLGRVCLSGRTSSLDFPIKNGARLTRTGEIEGFITQLSSDGRDILYSTYVGLESLATIITGVGVQNSIIYAVGFGIDRRAQGIGYALKIDPAKMGAASIMNTHRIGAGQTPQDVVVDQAGFAYIAGDAYVSQQQIVDAFVTKLDLTKTGDEAVVYSTFIGGSRLDLGQSLAVDGTGQVYVVGRTASVDFPVTAGALQPSPGKTCAVNPNSASCYDGFIAKLNAQGAPIYGSYLGGSDEDRATDITIDANGQIYLTGATSSPNFPTTPGAVQQTYNGGVCGDAPNTHPCSDLFVVRIDLSRVGRDSITYASYLGGAGDDDARGFSKGHNNIIANGDGSVWITGTTSSTNFPVTQNAVQRGNGGEVDGFLIKLRLGDVATPTPTPTPTPSPTPTPTPTPSPTPTPTPSPTPTPTRPLVSVSAASYSGNVLASESIVAAFGTDLATTTQIASGNPLPTTLGGTTVKVKDSAGMERLASLFSVSPLQINYQIPAGTATGEAKVTATAGQGIVSAGNIMIDRVLPGLFTADASGGGIAAAVVLRVMADGDSKFEPVVQYDAAQNRFVAVPIDLGPEGDQVFLILFGTGWRFRSALGNVRVQVRDVDAPVSFAGPQGEFFGLDQINALLPRSLIGLGEVDVTLTVDGKTANKVKAQIK